MSDILVKPGDLRQASSDLRQSARKISHSINEVDEVIRAVGPAKFSGRQADQIRTRFRAVRERLMAADDLVNQFALKLDQLAREFEKTDRQLAGQNMPWTGNPIGGLLDDLIRGWEKIIHTLPDINIPWPPKLFPLPIIDLPRPPWDPSPVYAPGPGDVVVGGDGAVVSPQQPTGPTTETLPLTNDADTGKNECFDFVKDQRDYNERTMPGGMAGKAGQGLYSGDYTGSGSFKDATGKSFDYGQEPKLGAIMVESPKNSSKDSGITFGHVSIVSSLEKDASGKVSGFTISETSWGTDKSAVHQETFTWNESKGRYVSSSGRVYDSFVY